MLFTLSAVATTAEMYFSPDKNGQTRVTNVQEGTQAWIVVYDPDENIDCDVRDKIWTDVKIMDPKTGAYIVWSATSPARATLRRTYTTPGTTTRTKATTSNSAGWLGATTSRKQAPTPGLFVSKRAFQIGTREDYDCERCNTHVVDDDVYPDGAGGRTSSSGATTSTSTETEDGLTGR